MMVGRDLRERQRPLVSAIITSFQRREYVCDAVDSALEQDYRPLEVLVVDDGSTDGTVELLRDRYGDGIRLLTQPNRGVSAARNAGVEAAKGEFVAFLDDDDVWLPHKTRLQMAVFQAHPDTVVVGGGVQYIDARGEPVLRPAMGSPVVGYETLCVRTALPGTCSNELVRRSAFLEIGGFDESLPRAEDRDLWIRMARVGMIRTVQEPTVSKRVHGGPRVSIPLLADARKRVSDKIPEPELRRRAEAMTDFFLWGEARRVRRLGLATVYLLRSLIRHPREIDPSVRRVRKVVETILPSRLVEVLGAVKRRSRTHRSNGI